MKDFIHTGWWAPTLTTTEDPELKVRENYRLAVEMCIMFGGCQMYHKIEGDDSTEGGNEYLTPLYMEKVKKGSLLYIKVIEPLYATPLEFNTSEPLKENYYRPDKWTILGTTLHHTRLCHFVYNYVPTLLKPVYWFNGYPLIQLVLSYLIGFESIRKEIINIVSRYNINIFKTSLDALLDYDAGSTFEDGQSCYDRLKLAQAIMTNFSIFALDNNPEAPEEWQQFNMTITGLSEILSQNAELICAVIREPAIVLYGTSPKGFNSSGDIELNIWHETIHNFQEKCLRANFNVTFQLIQMDLFGEIDDDLIFEFEPLKELSELEKSQIRINDANAYATLVNAGIVLPQETREVLKEDPDSGFNNLMSDKEFESLFNEQLPQLNDKMPIEDNNGKN
jgi:phage-related protein (TIGR01555 family)